MFWTDWGRVPKIERSFLNGDGRTSIVSSGLVWPNDVTVDLKNKMIFWVEAYIIDKIETADYNGHRRTKLVEYRRLHMFSVTYYERSVYWSDWYTRNIQALNTSNNSSSVSTFVVPGKKLMGVTMLEKTSQPNGKILFDEMLHLLNISKVFIVEKTKDTDVLVVSPS